MTYYGRRSFLKAAALGAAAAGLPGLARAAASDRHPLGLDNFAVRAMGWKAPQLVDYAASLGCDSLVIAARRAGHVGGPPDGRRHRAQY